MNRLDDKVAVITGGAGGQGAAEAELFVAAGAQVVITDVDRDGGSATATRLGAACEFVEHDVASEEAWARVVRGVVDRDCRVHGVANLYVAGGSVFPTAGHAGPTFTLTALAIRLAERLKEVLRRGR